VHGGDRMVVEWARVRAVLRSVAAGMGLSACSGTALLTSPGG